MMNIQISQFFTADEQTGRFQTLIFGDARRLLFLERLVIIITFAVQ
jgi:hypothetical protein